MIYFFVSSSFEFSLVPSVGYFNLFIFNLGPRNYVAIVILFYPLGVLSLFVSKSHQAYALPPGSVQIRGERSELERESPRPPRGSRFAHGRCAPVHAFGGLAPLGRPSDIFDGRSCVE